jgi:hypothetical protein
MPEVKIWYKSVTLWFNLITLALGVLELAQTVNLIPAQYVFLGTGIGNLILRLFFTKTNLETPAKVAEQKAGI